MALGELVVDVLPTTPSRKLPMPFAARIVSGGLCGGAIGAPSGALVVGAIAGIIGAVIGTLGGHAFRARLAAAFGRDLPAALIEDAVAIGGALGIFLLGQGLALSERSESKGPVLAARQTEIRVWTARAVATVLAETGTEFERATGYRLNVSSGLPADFLRRVDAGEPFDLFISAEAPVDEWIKAGRIIAGTRTVIARSGIGVEVRAGAPKPDISTADAFRRALLDAKSIAYLRVGSGLHVAGLVERLGIAEAIAAKVTRPETDIVSELVARGEVELGLVVITQILTTPGVDLVGPLPAELQGYVTFAAGTSATSSAPDAARQLVAFLTGPRAAAVMQERGLELIPPR
jgi:molybdate transport system substrate-binding protein